MEALSPLGEQFLLLPSFPTLLKLTAGALLSYFPSAPSSYRLLTTRRTIALGGVLSSLSHWPMLYPHGASLDYTPAFAIEGAADVDNPLTLLTDVLGDGQAEGHLIEQARRVGLPVKWVVAVLDMQLAGANYLQEQHQVEQIEALFSLGDTLEWLLADKLITPPLAAAIQTWQSRASGA